MLDPTADNRSGSCAALSYLSNITVAFINFGDGMAGGESCKIAREPSLICCRLVSRDKGKGKLAKDYARREGKVVESISEESNLILPLSFLQSSIIFTIRLHEIRLLGPGTPP